MPFSLGRFAATLVNRLRVGRRKRRRAGLFMGDGGDKHVSALEPASDSTESLTHDKMQLSVASVGLATDASKSVVSQ